MQTRTTQGHSENHWTRPAHSAPRGKEKTAPRASRRDRRTPSECLPPAHEDGPGSADEHSGVDLRRRHRADHADRLVRLASYLPPTDRALVEAVYLHGRSAIDIALLAGQSVRRVRSRIRTVVKRVVSPQYLFVLRKRDSWTKIRKQVATAVVIEGLSMRRAAPRLKLSYHTVRRHIAAIVTMFEADKSTS